ncbi:hypothetical protein FRB94_005782 [Tulasnella sp. JGI-2019a]|nr:hypothetical protein FRB94_005782 [Tulasnella sp. JGI-2019a]
MSTSAARNPDFDTLSPRPTFPFQFLLIAECGNSRPNGACAAIANSAPVNNREGSLFSRPAIKIAPLDIIRVLTFPVDRVEAHFLQGGFIPGSCQIRRQSILSLRPVTSEVEARYVAARSPYWPAF